MGAGADMSRATSSMAAAWSGVSSYSNDSSNSCCQGLSAVKACPGRALRSAYRRSSSAAMSRMAFLTRRLTFSHWPLPSWSTAGRAPSLEEYFCTRSKDSTGTLSLSPPLYDSTMNSRRTPPTSSTSRPW